MSIHRNVTVVVTLAAAMILSTAAVATVSAPPESAESSRAAVQTTATNLTSPGAESFTGEHALEYLSRLAREAAVAGKSGTDLSDHSEETRGGSNGTPSAAHRGGEPVGAGGTSGGSISPFALAGMR